MSKPIEAIATAIIFLAGSIFFAAFILKSDFVMAQNKNLGSLLTELTDRSEQEGDFTFSIVLANPPNGSFLEAVIGTEDGFTVSEIGEDYVCVNRLAGAALTKGCIPFTNIASIAFLDE